jgi:putative transposase
MRRSRTCSEKTPNACGATGGRRQLIEQYRLSLVRACRLVGLNRWSLNYRPRRPDDSAVRERLRELAAERRRFGYRRLGWLLAREGHVMNRKKLYRIYREEKLMVRRRA